MDDMIGKIFGDFKVIDKHNSETKYDYKYVYECVNCGNKENKSHNYLKHTKSKVAEAFVDNSNPIMFNTVNHKDCNEKNNDYRNLEWCTDKYNTYYSYQTLPPDRNRIECILVFPDGNKKRFESYADIIRYKRENDLEFSETGLQKYCKSKGFKLIKLGKTSNVGRTGWTKEQINELMTDEEVVN